MIPHIFVATACVFPTYKRRNGNLLRYQCLISKYMENQTYRIWKGCSVFFSPRTHIVRRLLERLRHTLRPLTACKNLWQLKLQGNPLAKVFVSGTLRSLFLHWILGLILFFFPKFFEGGMVGRFGVFQIFTPPKLFFCAFVFFV